MFQWMKLALSTETQLLVWIRSRQRQPPWKSRCLLNELGGTAPTPLLGNHLGPSHPPAASRGFLLAKTQPL